MGIRLLLGALVVGGVGCARSTSKPESDAQERAAASAMGATMQKDNLMSQGDYVKICGLEHQVATTHAMSNEELDWTLGLLKKADNGIARARAMTALSSIHPMSDAQKAKILPAIAPYLTSTMPLDKASAQRVQHAAQNSG